MHATGILPSAGCAVLILPDNLLLWFSNRPRQAPLTASAGAQRMRMLMREINAAGDEFLAHLPNALTGVHSIAGRGEWRCMACKQPAAMAQRKRPGSSGSMAEPRVRPGPPPFPVEESDLVAQGERPYRVAREPDSKDSRPATPVTPDHARSDCRGHPDCHTRPDSVDGDSSSDYVNNTSEDEEEDYDEGLPEEDEGVTYYIRYCPEDDSYLEGTDCNEGDYRGGRPPQPPADTDECQEAVEEWAESEGQCEAPERNADSPGYDGTPEPVLDRLPASLAKGPPPRDEEDEEEGEESEGYCPNEEDGGDGGDYTGDGGDYTGDGGDYTRDGGDYTGDGGDYTGDGGDYTGDGGDYTGDYYAPEDNGNSVRSSPYRVRRAGEGGEDAEEDIDQIVAEIKMSMSMGSLSSSTDHSPEELPPDATPGRPKSLNIPPARHGNPDLQRGYKARARTPDERPKWAQQEQVSNQVEPSRRQHRSDLNGPLENNNVPEQTKKTASFPSFVDVPGPCEPEDLIDGIIFAANYLGSTQLLSERNPSKNIRMMQAQEAVSRVKRVQKAAKIKKKASPEGDAQALTEVDLFISTQRIKVLNADTQETMMDNALRTISYIADIGNIVVLMARRRMPRTASQDCIETTPGAAEGKKQYKMICHVFESEDAQLIAQSIGQAFSVAYQEFLRANGINPEDLSQKEYSDIINTQEMYNDDLIHFSNSENCKELQLEKQKGEILGVVLVESGWGSILPTVILANMMNGGPAARSGKLSIGDQIMSINNTSLVGLPLATCQGIIKGLKNQLQVKLNIVSCPPVTTVLIKRPDLKYQLGFSVQNGIICSLMRGGIAERGGVRVGHRIIEINGQSVVATAHEKIVQALSNSVGEIHMKTMPAAMFRLLTGQETPLYI
ncbi:hypothetical protein AAFF_G00087250 [Aldrovandia affinis]|uniref:Uncharacterized protein n=1 Tax=Aldrovandia affinis TaxID=143900 RepID=A0AAD7RWC5_9TELE|nr:hypothetical protein AAFF_G00087250 [Aldrovandia affinis]